MNLYAYSDYRVVLRLLLNSRKGRESRFSSATLAEAIGVQKPYLSKVLNGKADLNSDQLFRAAQFFELPDEEEQYLSLLLEHARTGLADRKTRLKKEISAIQLRHRRPERSLKGHFQKADGASSLVEYYYDPDLSLIHMYLGIREFQERPEMIAERLGMPRRRFRELLNRLVKLGIVERDSITGRYALREADLMLDYDSAVSDVVQLLFRVRSAQHLVTLPRKQRCAFSMTFAADEKTRIQIHELFLKLLKEAEPLIKKAPEEEVFQMNFDLFPWQAK